MRLTVEDDQRDPDWTRAGVFRVSPDVYRIPLPLPNDALKAVNVYAIRNSDGVVLIDGGWAVVDAERALTRALSALDCDFERIHRFLVTHAHRDHYTQAIAIRRRFGTHVSIGTGERPTLTAVIDLPDDGGFESAERLRACGARELSVRLTSWRAREPGIDLPWEYPNSWIEDSEVVPLASRSLECIVTPGHTRGHLVFHEAQAELLFAGDHLLPHITPSIGFERAPSASPLREYLSSLRLVATLPEATLLPAHGPVAPSIHARANEILAHHEERLDQCERMVGAGAETAFEVANLLKWTRRRSALADLDELNQMLAVLETSAHLKVLVEQSRLSVEIVDGVDHYGDPGTPTTSERVGGSDRGVDHFDVMP